MPSLGSTDSEIERRSVENTPQKCPQPQLEKPKEQGERNEIVQKVAEMDIGDKPQDSTKPESSKAAREKPVKSVTWKENGSAEYSKTREERELSVPEYYRSLPEPNPRFGECFFPMKNQHRKRAAPSSDSDSDNEPAAFRPPRRRPRRARKVLRSAKCRNAAKQSAKRAPGEPGV